MTQSEAGASIGGAGPSDHTIHLTLYLRVPTAMDTDLIEKIQQIATTLPAAPRFALDVLYLERDLSAFEKQRILVIPTLDIVLPDGTHFRFVGDTFLRQTPHLEAVMTNAALSQASTKLRSASRMMMTRLHPNDPPRRFGG